MLEGRGDLLPVSALPVDGEFPTGTARHEKRRLADEIPVWDPEICIDCARCALVCPHAAIRLKLCEPDALAGVDLPSKTFRAKEHPGLLLTIQVTPDDCTGCGVCVDVCPAKSKSEVKHKALDMTALAPIAERERDALADVPRRHARARRHARPRDHEGFADRANRCSSSRACARAAARRRISSC